MLLSGDLIEAWPKIITSGKENMKCEKFFHLYNSEHNTRVHCLKLATTRSRLELLFQSESCLALEQATYACGRGRHCEFLQESAGQGMGHLKFNKHLSPSSTSTSKYFLQWVSKGFPVILVVYVKNWKVVFNLNFKLTATAWRSNLR